MALTIAVVAMLDVVTGTQLILTVFYVAPVALTAWAYGRTAGFVVAVVTGLVGVVAAAVPGTTAFGIILWNGASRTVVYLAIAWLVATQADLLEEADRRSSVDPLTGLLTRRRFYELVRRELALALRTDAPSALVYIDLDGLKRCNDVDGHEAGDELIVCFAEALLAEIRSTDIGARMGGDEFAIFLPATTGTEALALVVRLNRRAAEGRRACQFSAGVASLPPGRRLDLDEVVHAADEVMYEAKREGGGRTRLRELAEAQPSATD